MLARLFPEVRSLERQRFLTFFLLAALLLAGQAVGGTAAESLLLSRMGVEALPAAMVLGSLATIAGASLYSRWIGALRHETSFVFLLALGMLTLAIAVPLVKARWSPVYTALFCFNWLTWTIYLTHFFTLVGDYFDTLALKRLLPLFTVGATCGEIAGGFTASAVSSWLGAEGLLGLWIGFQALAAVYLWSLRGRLSAWNPPVPRAKRLAGTSQPRVAPSGWAYLRRSRLGLAMAGMGAALMVTNTVVQYLHSDIFLRTFRGEGELAGFLGMFVAVTNLLELAIGARLTPWMVRRFGVGVTNLVQPVGAMLTLLWLSGSYTLVPAMLAWMNRKMLQDSLASPVRAMLYSAFPTRFRAPLRATVDGVVGPATQMVASLLLGLLQHYVAVASLVWVGLVSAGFTLLAAWRVRTVYMLTLVEDLSQARLHLPESPGDPPSRHTACLLAEQPKLANGTLQELAEQAFEPDETRARAALARLRESADPLGTVLLARSLDDPRAAVRQSARRALASRGEAALPHLEPYFRSARVVTVEAAYEAVADGATTPGRELLAQELRLLVRESLRHLFLADAARAAEAELLRLASEDHSRRCQRLAFKLLSLLEGEHLMAPVMNSLRFANAAARANAMEVLSNLGDREAAGLLVLLTESSSTSDKLASAARLVPDLAEVPGDKETLLELCTHSTAPFVRRAAQGDEAALRRLATLKSFDLFAELSLEELEEVAARLLTERFGSGETVEGLEPRLYLRVEGRVDPDIRILGVTPALDNGPARYRVRVLETATFWSLRQDDFHALIRRFPEIGLAIFRRLARQIKGQEAVLKAARPAVTPSSAEERAATP